MRPSSTSTDERVDWLINVVEQQQQRLSILEALVERQRVQIERLERNPPAPAPLPPRALPLQPTDPNKQPRTPPPAGPMWASGGQQHPPPLRGGPPAAAAVASAPPGRRTLADFDDSIALSDSMKALTSQLERQLRASDTFGDGASPFRPSPETCPSDAASPVPGATCATTTSAPTSPPARLQSRLNSDSGACGTAERTLQPPTTPGAASEHTHSAGQLRELPPPPPWMLTSNNRGSPFAAVQRPGSGSQRPGSGSRNPTPPEVRPGPRTPAPPRTARVAGSSNPPSRPASGAAANSSAAGAPAADLGAASSRSNAHAGGGASQSHHPRARASPQRQPLDANSAARRPPSVAGGRAQPGSGAPSRSSRPASARRAAAELTHVATLQGATEQPVTGIAVSECGSGLVTAGLDGQLQLWTLGPDDPSGLGTTVRSAQRWRRTLTQPVGGGEVNALALLGSVLACGCQDGSVRLYRLFKEHSAFVLYSLLRKQHSAVRGPFAAGGADDGADDSARAAAAAAASEVMCVALSSTVQSSRTAPLLASGAQDGTVCLWDSSSGRLHQQLRAHEGGGNGWVMALLMARHEDGKSGLLLTASYDRTVRVWSRASDEMLASASGLGSGTAASGSLGSAAFGSCCSAMSGVSGGFCGAPGGGQGAQGGWVLQRTLSGHEDGVLGLELSRSRRHAYSASNDHSVRVWELASGACLQVLRLHECSVSALGWHLASGCLATGAEDGKVHLWDVSAFDEAGGGDAAAELVQSLSIEHCEVLCIVPSADGTALFCGLDDGSFALIGSAS
jgi:WD40 repeat protein